MRLSEAILFGAIASPQSSYGVADEPRACALHAAADALDINPLFDDLTRFAVLMVRFSLLGDEHPCPACSWMRSHWRRYLNKERIVEDVVIHLNNDHRWTRERIADWIRMLEIRDVAAADEARQQVARINRVRAA